MTTERLSELQDLALAGKKPESEQLTSEEAKAWEHIQNRMEAYENKLKNILKGGNAYGKGNS